MKTYTTHDIKNVVLLGASGSGKTTLAEAMAFDGGVIDRRGSVENDNTLSDYTDVEHLYKRSIYPTILFAEYMGRKLNIIDTPGSDDFCGGLFSAFRVADVGVMLLNAQNGFEVGTEIQARYARRHEKPIIAVINQLDHEKASWEGALDSLKAASQVTPVVVQYPVNPGPGFDAFVDVLLMKMYRFKGDTGVREELEIPESEMERAAELNRILTEAAAENDEALMELYFDKGVLTQDELRSGLKLGLAKRDLIPVFCASGKRDIGAKRLMEFIINVAPGPIKAPAFKTTDGREIAADSSAPTSLFVFKSAVEPHLGEMTFFRVVSGKVTEGMELVNSKTGNKEKISQLFAVAGKSRVKVTEMEAGDIGCTVKLKGTKTNQTLCSPGADIRIEPIRFPEPRYRAAVRPLKTGEDEKLGELLNRAHFEDPTILVEYSKELKQTIVQGQGEHHLNILKWQLANQNKMEVEFFAPKIPYRETITKVAAADYRHKKQSGGAGQFGEVWLVIEPYVEGMPEPLQDRRPRAGAQHQEQRRGRSAVGRQADVLQRDRRRSDRRPLPARDSERNHGENGGRAAHGLLCPRHPRGRLRRQDASGRLERAVVQAGGPQCVQGSLQEGRAENHGADLLGRGTRAFGPHGRRDERPAESPGHDRGHEQRQGIRAAGGPRSARGDVPLLDDAQLADQRPRDLFDEIRLVRTGAFRRAGKVAQGIRRYG